MSGWILVINMALGQTIYGKQFLSEKLCHETGFKITSKFPKTFHQCIVKKN